MQRLSGIKLAVFDMAGTVINEHGLVYKTLYETIHNFNIPIKEKDIDKWHGANKYQVLDYFLKDNCHPKDFDQQRKILHNNFDNNLKEKYFFNDSISLIHPKVPDLFTKMRNSGIKIGLNTGYSSDIQLAIIKNLKLNELIDDFVASDMVTHGRPEPFMIQKLMYNNNIDNPNLVIKTGDTPNDILEGHNAKCLKSIGVLSGASDINLLKKYNPSLIINNITELTNF